MATRNQSRGGNRQYAEGETPILESLQRLTVAGITFEFTQGAPSDGSEDKMTVAGQVREGDMQPHEIFEMGRFFGRLLRRQPQQQAGGDTDGRGRVTDPATDMRVGDKTGQQGRNRGSNAGNQQNGNGGNK